MDRMTKVVNQRSGTAIKFCKLKSKKKNMKKILFKDKNGFVIYRKNDIYFLEKCGIIIDQSVDIGYLRQLYNAAINLKRKIENKTGVLK